MAHRKQQKHRPKKSKKRKSTSLNAAQAVLLQRLRNLDDPSLPDKVVFNSPNHEKMSDVIIKFAAPWLDEVPDDDSVRPIIELALMAWNFAIIKEHEGEPAVDRILRETATLGTSDATREEFKAFLEKFFQRKRELFPDNQRMILDYELTESSDNFHLNVVSTIFGDEVRKVSPNSKLYRI